MTDILKNNISDMEYIDIFDCLSIDDYYKTDSHWKQEELSAVVRDVLPDGNRVIEFKCEGEFGVFQRN